MKTCRFCDNRGTHPQAALLRNGDFVEFDTCGDHHMAMTPALVELACKRPWFTLAECYAALNNELERADRWYAHETGAERIKPALRVERPRRDRP